MEVYTITARYLVMPVSAMMSYIGECKICNTPFHVAMSSFSSDTVSIHIFLELYKGYNIILELSFSESVGVHDRLHIYPLCGWDILQR